MVTPSIRRRAWASLTVVLLMTVVSSCDEETLPTSTERSTDAPTPVVAPTGSPPDAGTPPSPATATPEPASTSALALTPIPGPTSTPVVTETPTPEPTLHLSVTVAAVPSGLPQYDRDDWRHWIDEDSDCQDARHEVLVMESLIPVTYRSDRECRVDTGQWFAAFTGTTVTEASKLDIDHLVLLANAHQSGGWTWTEGWFTYPQVGLLAAMWGPDARGPKVRWGHGLAQGDKRQ